MATIDGAVVELAGRQCGLIRREQLRGLGASPKVVRRLQRDGLLRVVSPQVLALGGGPLDHEVRCRAALWQAGPGAALSHAAAAHRWAFTQVAAGAVEVVVDHGTTVPVATIGRVHVSRNLRPGDVVHRDGLPTTTPRRTLRDLAPRLGGDHLARIIQDLRRRELFDLEAFAAELGLGSHRGVAGVVRLEQVVDRLVVLPRGDSWLEDEFIAILERAGVALPETQVSLSIDGRTYRVDNLWRPERFVAELDGHQFHSTRPDRDRDAERSARITGAGYDLVTITYDQVSDRPDYVVDLVRRRLVARRRVRA